MKRPNIAPIRVGNGKFAHPRLDGNVAWLPWPRGSAAANRFFNQRRAKRNKRLARARSTRR